MAITFKDFSELAESNPAQYLELMHALQHIETQSELEATFAQNLLNYADYEVLPTQAGHTFINTGTRIAGEYLGPVSSSTETALEIATEAYDYEVIAENGQVIYRANMGAMETAAGSGSYQATSLLSLDVGVVGAAIAPVLGIAFGVGLYQSNPQFWTLLSEKLLPFCYPGTTKIPAWMDIVESALHPGTYEQNVVIDKRVVEAIQKFFLEQDVADKNRQEHEGGVQWGQYYMPGPLYKMYLAPNSDMVVALTNRYGGFTVLENGSNYPMYVSLISDAHATQGVSFVATTPGNNEDAALYMLALDTEGISRGFAYLPRLSVYGYDSKEGRRRQYGVLSVNDDAFGSFIVGLSNIGTAGITNFVAYLQDGDFEMEGEVPEGAEMWEGDDGSLGKYSKPIIYMKEDPDNPGHFIPEARDGIAIAVPIAGTQPAPQFESTKPENWPEDVDWPLEIEFPWEAPDGYEGEWPETMPWPLPADKPDWWPDVVPYPGPFTYPAVSNDPEVDPDPNQNVGPGNTGPYVETAQPTTTIDPSEGPEPQPEPDPSIPSTTPSAVVPVDPPGPPGVIPPPFDNGASPLPLTPVIPVPFTSGNDGLISVYHPTDAQLKAFSSWLWVTYADPSIDKLWNNPFDGVIGLMEIYCTPTDIGIKTIRSGFLDSGVQSQTISRYTSIDCGTVYVPEYYGNYLDYSPYAKAHIYLPFIGIVELNVDDVIGHGINVTYKIDEYNGACIAIITCARHHVVNGEDVDYNSVTYQFSGNCAVELPLAGGSQASIRAGLIQAAAYGLSSVIGGLVTAAGPGKNSGGRAVSEIGYGVANAIGSVVSAKSSVQHSGSFGSSYGALGIKIPYLIISRPRQLQVINYSKIYGYPAHAGVTIGSCEGYLRVREVHVKSATATDDEKKLIEGLLKEGVYVTEE